MTCRCGRVLQNVAIPSPNIVCMTCFTANMRSFEGRTNSYRDLPRLKQIPMVDGFVASEWTAAA